MHLNVEQNKLVHAQPGGHNLIKGVAGSGKTTVAVHKVAFLLDNYCYEPEDRILLVTYNRTLVNYIQHLYNKVQGAEKDQTLFNSEKVDIQTVDQVMFKYFLAYKRSYKLNYELIMAKDTNLKYEIMADCINQIKKRYPGLKVLDHRYIRFLLDEIDWIKSCNYMEIEEYQNADRLGRMSKELGDGPKKLQKNSDLRRAIFEIMLLYGEKLSNLGYVDFKDCALMAYKQAQQKVEKKYTHIIVDESHDLTRVQLQFLKLLFSAKDYSSFTFIADTAQSIYTHSWLVKGRSFASIGFDMSGRSSSLTKNYRTTTQIALAAYSLLESEPDITEDEEYIRPALIDRQGVEPVYRQFRNPEQEVLFVIKEIREYLAGRYEYRDIVIIAKNHTQLAYIKEFLDRKGLQCIAGKNEADFESQAIRLLTMHSIKGLEYKVVFIIGLNDGIIPYPNYHDMDIAMEATDRKLLYVGMTRAFDVLYLTSSGSPSRFMADIDPKLLKISSRCLVKRFYPIPLEDFFFGTEIADLYSKEEKVRQWFLKELIDTYKYPIELIEVEHNVNQFSRRGLVDIAIMIYKNNTRTPYIFVEVKAYGAGIQSGVEQAKSYLSHSPTCQYAVVTDGNEIVIFNRNLEVIDDIPQFDPSMLPEFVSKKRYVDFKHQREYNLIIDEQDQKEIVVESATDRINYGPDKLEKILVYSNIAAGQPNLINSQLEDSVHLPRDWFDGNQECFFLQVRGDSMIDANIDDGDLVLIRKQQTAQNRDIVAVRMDDDATLKRFIKMGDSVLLIPENENYEPIQMSGDAISIIGIAMGILKPGNK